MLTLNQITYRVAGRTLLDDASLHLPKGHHVGLVGRNGCGKSTLFKLVLGQIHPDAGIMQLTGHMNVATVAQETPAGSQTPLEYVMASHPEIDALLKESEHCEDADRIGEIHARLAELDAYTAEARAAQILVGLGFNDTQQNQPVSSFSGGWRMRVALAAALFQEPDLLLLDEPSNHLDLEAALWLESFLKSYPHTLMIISHDRQLLNAVTNRIYHLHQGKVTQYNGNYDFYEVTRKQQMMFNAAHNEKMVAQRQHMMNFVNRFRASAAKARQAQSRLKAIEKLEPISVMINDPTLTIEFPEPEKLAPPLINFENVSVGYDNKTILRNLSGSIAPEDRIALIGHNGNGKSTFAKLLSGRLTSKDGYFHSSPKVRVGFFHQHQMEELKAGWSGYDHLMEVLPKVPELQLRAHLGRFGFNKDKSEVAVEKLSGGEKARLVLSMITAQKPNILIFDEPTNHLDVEMRESLMLAINDFKGAVILITHDWHLLRHTVDRLWLVADQTVKPYDGDLDDYRREVLGIAPKKAPSDNKKKKKN
ncbi:MAG: ABC-F family ATP-binding cassette domain-containing protein [Janthinobacterium lividum]